MAQSAHRRSPGEAISANRRAKGWTQQHLADLCGYSQSTISRLERGRQSASDIAVLALVAQRLGMSPLEVGLSATDVAGPSVDRRRFIGAAAALSATAALSTDVPRRPVDPAVVDHLRHLRATLVQSDSLYGPQCVVGAVLDHVAVIERQLLPAATGELRRTLLEVASEWAEFAGWLHEDLGRGDLGLWWSDRAMEWAQEADDPVRQAFVLMRKAQQSVGLMQQQRAVGLAGAALRVRGDVPARIRASAHLQMAHGYALADDSAATGDALDKAHELSADDRTPTDQLGGYCVPSYVEAQRAACHLRLGEPAKAVATYQQALVEWPPIYQRERGLHMARLANAHAANRAPEAACAAAHEALEISRETESRRTSAELQRVLTGLTPWQRTPLVKKLAEELAAV